MNSTMALFCESCLTLFSTSAMFCLTLVHYLLLYHIHSPSRVPLPRSGLHIYTPISTRATHLVSKPSRVSEVSNSTTDLDFQHQPHSQLNSAQPEITIKNKNAYPPPKSLHHPVPLRLHGHSSNHLVFLPIPLSISPPFKKRL